MVSHRTIYAGAFPATPSRILYWSFSISGKEGWKVSEREGVGGVGVWGGGLCCQGNSGVECRSLNCIKMMLSPPKSLNLNRCWGGVEGTWTDARIALSEIKSKRAAPPHISISVLLLHISGGHPDRYVDNGREHKVKWRFILCPVMQERDVSQGII